jgi:hypothetical protein
VFVRAHLPEYAMTEPVQPSAPAPRAETIGAEAFLSPDYARAETTWVHADPYAPGAWPPVLLQDFDNMSQVQRGMRSAGFRGCLPNPKQEAPVTNFHRNLSRYMGRGGPEELG